MIRTGEAGCASLQPATLILGLGNPLRGDDGVGPFVIKELLSQPLPDNVEVLDGGSGGLDLLSMLEGRERVVVVDAAQIGRDPGKFVRFTPEDVHLSSRTFASHHASLNEVLTLANALGRTLPEVVIFGVQPAEIGWGEGLSPAVQNAIPALLDQILDEL